MLKAPLCLYHCQGPYTVWPHKWGCQSATNPTFETLKLFWNNFPLKWGISICIERSMRFPSIWKTAISMNFVFRDFGEIRPLQGLSSSVPLLLLDFHICACKLCLRMKSWKWFKTPFLFVSCWVLFRIGFVL